MLPRPPRSLPAARPGPPSARGLPARAHALPGDQPQARGKPLAAGLPQRRRGRLNPEREHPGPGLGLRPLLSGAGVSGAVVEPQVPAYQPPRAASDPVASPRGAQTPASPGTTSKPERPGPGRRKHEPQRAGAALPPRGNGDTCWSSPEAGSRESRPGLFPRGLSAPSNPRAVRPPCPSGDKPCPGGPAHSVPGAGQQKAQTRRTASHLGRRFCPSFPLLSLCWSSMCQGKAPPGPQEVISRCSCPAVSWGVSQARSSRRAGPSALRWPDLSGSLKATAWVATLSPRAEPSSLGTRYVRRMNK